MNSETVAFKVKHMSEMNGQHYIPGFLDPEQERRLLDIIDAQPWLDDLKRRVQHYGYKYDYKARTVDPSMYLGPLPGWALPLAEELLAKSLFPRLADQLIVNEFEPGRGISAHVDCGRCFDDTIASITLGSGCMMDFTRVSDGFKVSQYLQPGSIIVFSGEARYHWRHSIPARRSDVYEGQKIERGRRVSLTFRNVLLDRQTA